MPERPNIENFEKAVASWRDLMNHGCSNEADCDAGEAFLLMTQVDNEGHMEVYTSGHRVDPITIIQTMIEIVDAFVARDPNLTPMQAFMKSRDLVHAGADSVAPPPDASQAFNEMSKRIGEEDD